MIMNSRIRVGVKPRPIQKPMVSKTGTTFVSPKTLKDLIKTQEPKINNNMSETHTVNIIKKTETKK